MYTILILIFLEVFIRFFYLTKDYPIRFIDKYDVEKWLPNQRGFNVIGPRRQNYTEFNINKFGYNSFKEFLPAKNKTEIAIVGDSFIEGFHQNYYNSIGKKLELYFDNVEVYEYGYAGYDLADQLHLIHKYKESFELIDHVIIGLNYSDDLNRGEYKIIKSRMRLETSFYRVLLKSKLFVFLQTSGILQPISSLTLKASSILKKNKFKNKTDSKQIDITQEFNNKVFNFENLIKLYGFDKNRFIFLLDSSHTPKIFLDYLNKKKINYIDFSQKLNNSKLPTTFIYDQHWNDHGRTLIAESILEYFKNIRNF